MTGIRRTGGQSVARTVAVHTASPSNRASQRRWTVSAVAAVALLALLGAASSAPALVLTGGPVYGLPGGGSCSVSGVASQTGGATISCTGVNLSPHTHVYFGIKNDTNVNGNTMTGSAPTAASAAVFRFNSNSVNSITYTSTTSVTSAIPSLGSQTVSNQLVLTLTAGSASLVGTGGAPANNNNGDIQALFQITSGSSFTIRADVKASDPNFALGQAAPAVYDPSHSTAGAGGEISKVDVAFYYSDCGDGAVDSPAEQCDQGSGVNGNGTPGSCCSSTCTFKANLTACTDDGNLCTNDQCNGASPLCTHPNNSAPCNDGLFCNGTDTCGGGSCTVHTGNPCPGPDGDNNCSESCNEAADNCTAPDPNGSACSDGLFCNGSDSCSGGACTTHTGDPCAGPDGDTNCSESCDESADNCLAADPDGTSCRPAAGACDLPETCSSGACPADAVKPAATVCNPGSGDSCDPDEVCDGSSATCPADTVTGAGTTCRTGSGDACDPDETCNGVADAPCPGDVVLSSSTVCRTGSGDSCDPDELCTGTAGLSCPGDVVQSSSTVCRPGSGDSCDPDELCTGTAGQTCPPDVVESSSTVCRTGSGDLCDPDEVCPGVPAGTCAADVVQPPTTVCRGAAGVCDAADHCTGTAGASCPADAKQPAMTPCRPAAQPCDAVEVCDGSSNTCPADLLKPDGASCSDGLFCNGAETCSSGVCTDQPDPCILSDICNESTDTCQTDVCPATPQTCRTAAKSLLIVKNKMDDSKDKLIWKYIKGQSTTQSDFADPTMSADYAFCVYAGPSSTLVAQVHVPPGPPWRTLGTKGYKYLDPTLAADGTQKVFVQGTGVSGKTKALLVTRGTGAPDPLNPGPLQLPVTAQLINYQTGICWQGYFPTSLKSTSVLFKAKQ